MKKILLIIACIAMALGASAVQPSSANKDIVQDLMNFFAVRGIDASYEASDNSLNFKTSGGSYWVCVIGDKAPFLIDFHKEGVLVQSASKEAEALKKCNTANSTVPAGKTFIKADAQKRKFVNFTTQYYIADRSDFVEFYNKSIETLDELESVYNSK